MNRKRRTKKRSDHHRVDKLFEQGRVLLSRGRLNEAIAAWQEVAKLVPGDAAAHCNLGGLYLRKGDFRMAIPCFQAALQLDPSYALAWCNLGVALRRTGLHAQAIEALKKAIQIDPRYTTAHVNLAEYLETGNRIEDAERHARIALSLDGSQHVAQLVLVRLHYRASRLDEAQEGLRRLLQADLAPDLRSNALKMLGRVLEKTGQSEAAYSAFAQSQQIQSHLSESMGIDRRAYPAMLEHIRSWVEAKGSNEHDRPQNA